MDLLATMQNCRKNARRRIQADSFHPNEIGHRCAAATLARAILSGLRQHPEEPPRMDLARKPHVPAPGSNGRPRRS